ncbi:glycosyltransferase [Thauera propionica]|jgi:glycosyltransferase involved in cell wall biosynthesis|uniref:glycosyltransferase n=1 Tax=Thauera propionica TaxID=2019431 RepID=UPI0023F58F85|nr:glycosyltransferase [Thauera propionica]MDD3676832.1 glycosyltransferase [Thauera propionica]
MSQMRAPAWRVCVHVATDAPPHWHPSLLAWLRSFGAGRTLCALAASQVEAFTRAWASACDLPMPPCVAVPDGAAVVEVLAALAPATGGCDVAYVRSDCAVAGEWDMLLARAACEDGAIAVASPLTAATPTLSPFAGPKPAWMAVDHVNRWLPQLSHGQVFEVPAPAPFCAYWRAAALEALARQGVEQALDQAEDALLRLGWRFVGCDWVYVDAPPGAASLNPRPSEGLQSFLTYHPLLRMRHGFGEAGAWGEASLPPPVPMVKPVQLHVAHSWGGGLGRWVEDYCRADEARWNLVLRSIGTWGAFGQRIALYRSHQMDRPLRDWLLDMPIGSIAVRHLQYRRILDEIVRDFRVDAIIVSSLIGHSLEVLDSGLPTTVVAHDYTPFCAALSIRFDGLCTHCDTSRLQQCFARNPLNRFFRDAGAPYWQAMREDYLARLRQAHIRVAAPSASVARNLRALAPALGEIPVNIIPHGMDFPGSPDWAPAATGRLRLVVLGSMAPQKGADLLAAALPALKAFADVYLVGCGDEGERFKALGADRVLARYERDALPEIIAGIAPHAGLLLSVVPETFSYTLSELWAMGVPPVATRLGGFADRIDDGVDGCLCALDAEDLVRVLRRLDADRALLAGMRARLLVRPVRSCAQMVADYHRLQPLSARSPLAGVRAGVPGRPLSERLQAADTDAVGALHVDRQVPLRTVLRDFSSYLQQKIAATPRLGVWRKRALLALLRIGARALK